MNKKNILLSILIVFLCADSIASSAIHRALADAIQEVEAPKKRPKGTIDFIFDKEELVDIINMLAEKKNVNVVLPTGATAINSTVTLAINRKLTLDEAWNLLYTLLDIAGYSMIAKEGMYVIVKNSKNVQREAPPIYINTPLSELPDNDERIQYLYYLSNIKASEDFDQQINELLKAVLPDDALYKADKNANGILIIAKSQDIKSVMGIIQEIDQAGFQEVMEVIRLRYTNAELIGQLFNDNILKTAAATPSHRYRLDARNKELEATYFSRNVKVIPEPRTNSLIVLGRVQAVERIKDFLFKYIDVELDAGRSILHVYELQYLDAQEFAPVLDRIVKSTRTGGTGQSKAETGAQTGTERFFEEVIILADTPAEASSEKEEGTYFGGNKLVIAARFEDWKRIKKLIEQLDKPQPQVIIEVLIADLLLDDTMRLGSIIRNPADIPFPGDVSGQAAMIGQVILDRAIDPTKPVTNNDVAGLTGVNADLNGEVVPIVSNNTVDGYTNIPATLEAGSTAIAMSDSNGKTWNLLEILKKIDTDKVLSHPHVIAINNQEAKVEVGETRLVRDQAAAATSGITRRKKSIDANTTIIITPRISSANTVNLQIQIDINRFIFQDVTTNADRISRKILTNGSVKSGDVLAIGGLVIETTSETMVETPIISKIPILGWLFKRKSKEIAQTSLTVFISPTIIQPKLRGGIGYYTQTYVEVAKDYAGQGSLFDSLRDPITRWFFEPKRETAKVLTEKIISRDEAHEIYDEELYHAAEVEAEHINEYLGKGEKDPQRDLAILLAGEEKVLPQRGSTAKPKPQKESAPAREKLQFGPKKAKTLKDILAEQDNPLTV